MGKTIRNRSNKHTKKSNKSNSYSISDINEKWVKLSDQDLEFATDHFRLQSPKSKPEYINPFEHTELEPEYGGWE